MRWAVAVGLIAALMALAQTQLRPGQLRSAMPGSLERTYLYAVSLDGWTGVEVGPGLKLEAWKQGLRLVAEIPAPAPPVPCRYYKDTIEDAEAQKLAQAPPCPLPSIQIQQLKPVQGVYRCGVAPQLVMRNGLVQMPGVDYRIADNVAILPADPGWSADDVVACLFLAP